MQVEQTEYSCIFCNAVIESDGLDPCALQLTACIDRGRHLQKEQTFFCHINCLQSRSAIHPANFYITESDFQTVSEQAAT